MPIVVVFAAPFGPSRAERLSGRDREADPAHGLDAARIGLHQLSGDDRRGARRGIPVRPAGRPEVLAGHRHRPSSGHG